MSIEKPISTTLSNMIAEANFTIQNVRTKILAAYEYAVQKEGFTPQEAYQLLKEKLEFSESYIRHCLPDEVKDKSKKRFAISKSQNSQENGENVVNITTAYDIKDAETTTTPLENKEWDIPEPEDSEPREQQQEIYDPQFVNKLIKENAKLQQDNENLRIKAIPTLSDKFDFEYDLEIKDQILPLVVTCFPSKKTGYVRLDKERIQQAEKKERSRR